MKICTRGGTEFAALFSLFSHCNDAHKCHRCLAQVALGAGLEEDLYSVSGETDYATLSPSPLVPNFPSSQLVPKVYTENQVRQLSSFYYIII